MRGGWIAALFALVATAACQGCGKQPGAEAPETRVEEAVTYTTSVDGLRMEPGTVRLMRPGAATAWRVLLDGKSYQSVDGFGMAITQASCYNLLKMTQADRTAFLKEVFDPAEGLGRTIVEGDVHHCLCSRCARRRCGGPAVAP